MADGKISFDVLVSAIATAVTDAQRRIEAAQVAAVGRFFDEDKRPLIMEMLLPSNHPLSEHGDEIMHQVPLITLAPTAMLRVKEMEITFEVDLGDLSDGEERHAGPVAENFKVTRRVMGVRHAAANALGLGQRRRAARVALKVEAVDLPEGLARLIGELNKFHGPALPPKDERRLTTIDGPDDSGGSGT